MTVEDINEYIKTEYGVEPDYPWKSYPTYATYRHMHNKKWFALYMEVPGDKVNLPGGEMTGILNIKCDTELISILSSQKGFAPAYHMNKEHWITLILDQIEEKQVCDFIDRSYEITR